MTYKDSSKRKVSYYFGVEKNEFAPRNDLRGKRFGRLYVMDFSHKGGIAGRTYYYKCKCDCGAVCIKSAHYLLAHKTFPHQSCGCWHREVNIASSTTHGHGSRKNRTYKVWTELKMRCANPKNRAFKDYGGRGIKVCDRWLNSFENFLADMGERPNGDFSIDRIDVNGDYCPENCRWATRTEQCNNRRSNIIFTFRGKTQTLMQWCKELGINYSNARCFCASGGRTIEDYVKFLNSKESNV